MLSTIRSTAAGVLVAVAIVAVPQHASATTIALYTAATDVATFVPGQSVTTPIGGPWSGITFNFFQDVAATVPTAAGTLFLLNQEYLGAPNTLNAATPGYIAQSTNIAAGAYVFNAAVVLQPSVQYFFYANTPILLSGNEFGSYPDGILYAALDATSPFDDLFGTQDAAFQLAGTPTTASTVPEPTSLLLLSTGAIALMNEVRRHKRTGRP